MCTVSGPKARPAIVSDGAAGAIIVWTDRRSGVFPGSADIYAQRIRASGMVDRAWPSGGLPVCIARGEQGHAVMVPDGAGGAIVAWPDGRDDSDIYAQHVLASGAVDPAWPADGRALCTATGHQIDPAIVPDGGGGAIVVWDDRQIFPNSIQAQHVLASGKVDPAWPADGLRLCTAPGGREFPRIVTDGMGGAIVAWHDERNDYGDIYAQHVLASGEVDPAWPADGRALCTAYEEQSGLLIVADGAGGAIVAWTDLRTGYSGYIDIYAQHVLASGTVDPVWPTNGRAISTAPDDQSVSGLVPDRSGGAIVAWTDLRSNRYDIYAQHLLASGTMDPAWPPDGFPVCTAPPGYRYGEVMVADGRGGAILAWPDARTDDTDIYAQHLRDSGVGPRGWPPDGLPVCSASGDQYNLAITADGPGQAIVTWQDHRGGGGEIYARRINTHGPPVQDAPREPQAFALHTALPRPASGEVRVSFDLPVARPVTVELFDPLGRVVRTLAAQQGLEAGTHNFSWDGTNGSGARLPRGLYLVRVSTGTQSITGKLLLLE